MTSFNFLSALNNFKAQLLQESNEVIKNKYEVPPELNSPFKSLSADSIILILSFLDPYDIGRFSLSNSYTKYLFSNYPNVIFREWRISSPLIHHLSDTKSNNGFVNWLQSRKIRIESDLKHLEGQRWVYNALASFSHSGQSGVYGLVSDLAWFNDERVRIAMSKRRFMALPTIVCEDGTTIKRFKSFKKTNFLGIPIDDPSTNPVVLGPLSFLPLTASSLTPMSEDQIFKIDHPPTDQAGFFVAKN